MKSLLIPFALLAVAFAQDHKCQVKFGDCFVLIGGYLDEALNRSAYTSIIGETVMAIDCTDENPDNHRMVHNSTVYATYGATGKLIISGWVWTLINSTGTYTMSEFNGNMDKCQKHDHEPIPKYSQIVGNLFQIVPVGDQPQGDIVICEGYYMGGMEPILTMIFSKEGVNMKLININALSKEASVTTFPRTVRPFDPTKDADLFKPCENAVETNKKVKLHQTLYEKIRDFVPTQN